MCLDGPSLSVSVVKMHTLLQERRLYEARRLLSETRAPIKQIAETLGFASAAYFARAFQHKTGKTPSAFRRGK